MSRPDGNEIIKALSKYRDLRFAELLAIALSLAVEQYPDEVRWALGKVFDVKQVERRSKTAGRMADDAMKAATNAQRYLHNIRKQVKELEDRIDRVAGRMTQRKSA